jgi:hypothetical protein
VLKDSTTGTCSIVTPVILGSATGLQQVIKHVRHQKRAMFPPSVMWQHFKLIYQYNLELPPVTVHYCQSATQTTAEHAKNHSYNTVVKSSASRQIAV